jgi:hypothetical protein
MLIITLHIQDYKTMKAGFSKKKWVVIGSSPTRIPVEIEIRTDIDL